MKLKKNVLLIFEPGRNFAPAIPVDKYVKKIEKEILTLTDVAKLIIFD